MTYDEAISEAILGARLRHPGMMEGSFIYYQFSGLRIEFREGSSSGWTADDAARNATDWYFYESPPIGEVAKRVVGGWGGIPKLWAPKPNLKLDPKKGGW